MNLVTSNIQEHSHSNLNQDLIQKGYQLTSIHNLISREGNNFVCDQNPPTLTILVPVGNLKAAPLVNFTTLLMTFIGMLYLLYVMFKSKPKKLKKASK